MQIDLDPKNWKSERPKPHEPFFGSGAPAGLAYLIGLTLMVTIVYYLR